MHHKRVFPNTTKKTNVEEEGPRSLATDGFEAVIHLGSAERSYPQTDTLLRHHRQTFQVLRDNDENTALSSVTVPTGNCLFASNRIALQRGKTLTNMAIITHSYQIYVSTIGLWVIISYVMEYSCRNLATRQQLRMLLNVIGCESGMLQF